MQKYLRWLVPVTAIIVVGLVMKSDRKPGPTGVIGLRGQRQSATRSEPAADLTFRPLEDLIDTKELPESLNQDEIARSRWSHGGRIFVLAWMIKEDDRPMRVETCLVFEELKDDRGYFLMHLYRHPDSSEPAWELSIMHASFPKGSKYFPGMWFDHVTRFDKRPGNQELYAAFSYEGVNWSFERPKGWKIVSCGVCERTWQEAIGEKPTQFFAR